MSLLSKLFFRKQKELTLNQVIENNKDAKQIRLIRVSAEQYETYEGSLKISSSYLVSDPFYIPMQMNLEEALKTLSHLFDIKMQTQNLKFTNPQTLELVLVEMQKYGFELNSDSDTVGLKYLHTTRYNFEAKGAVDVPKIDGVVDLIIPKGDKKVFKKLSISKRTFNWYTPQVSLKDISEFYSTLS